MTRTFALYVAHANSEPQLVSRHPNPASALEKRDYAHSQTGSLWTYFVTGPWGGVEWSDL